MASLFFINPPFLRFARSGGKGWRIDQVDLPTLGPKNNPCGRCYLHAGIPKDVVKRLFFRPYFDHGLGRRSLADRLHIPANGFSKVPEKGFHWSDIFDGEASSHDPRFLIPGDAESLRGKMTLVRQEPVPIPRDAQGGDGQDLRCGIVLKDGFVLFLERDRR